MPNSISAHASAGIKQRWVFDPVIVGPDIIEYTLTKAPHADGTPSSILLQRSLQDRDHRLVRESGAIRPYHVVLETQTTHRFWAFPACSRRFQRLSGRQPGPAFIEKIGTLHHSARTGPGALGTTTALEVI